MLKEVEAKIFLEDQRACLKSDGFKGFSTFNFGENFDENKEPFGSLTALNDDSLEAGHSIKLTVEEDLDIVLIPLIGGLEYKNDFVPKDGFLELGEAQILSASKGMNYEIMNPYPEGQISFLQIWLKNNSENFVTRNTHLSFDLESKNQLLPIIPEKIYIGKYDGRAEDIYRLKKANNGIFVFIIAGAFEVQNRLLNARDGLALKNCTEIEFEALSNDAILVVLEVE